MASQHIEQEANLDQPRRIPAILTYLKPFRLIEADNLDKWSATLEQINTLSWDYVKLHEIAGGIDVGLPAPYHMLVGRDGALALPPIPALRSDHDAVEFFNRCLAALLLGGIYCTAVNLDDVALGSVIDWKYLRELSRQSDPSNFHNLIRLRMAPPLTAIALLDPPIVAFNRLRDAAKIGFSLLSRLPKISPEYLLKGTSGIARRDWAAGLSNLWIVVEQLTQVLWDKEVLQIIKDDAEPIPKRSSQFEDTRTWTAANRFEYLHAKGLISKSSLRCLYLARKARNDLSHSGTYPTEAAAISAYQACIALLQTAAGDADIPLSRLNLSDHTISDPFNRPTGPLSGVSHWMPFPKLPGEEEAEQEDARKRLTEP